MVYTIYDVEPAVGLLTQMRLDKTSRLSTLPRDVTDIIIEHLHAYTLAWLEKARSEYLSYHAWWRYRQGSRHEFKDGELFSVVEAVHDGDSVKYVHKDTITDYDRAHADAIRRHYG